MPGFCALNAVTPEFRLSFLLYPLTFHLAAGAASSEALLKGEARSSPLSPPQALPPPCLAAQLSNPTNSTDPTNPKNPIDSTNPSNPVSPRRRHAKEFFDFLNYLK